MTLAGGISEANRTIRQQNWPPLEPGYHENRSGAEMTTKKNRGQSAKSAPCYWLFGAVLALLGFWVTRAFLLQIAFAGILAIAVWPLHQRLMHGVRTQLKTFISLVFVVAIGLILVLPFAVFGTEAVNDSSALVQWMAQATQAGVPPPHWLATLPFLGAWLQNWWQYNLTDPHGAAALLNRVNAAAVAKLVGTLATLFLSWSMFLLVTLLALFVILRDGARLALMACRTGQRLYGDFGERFVVRLADAIRGTVTGTVFVSFGEGLLIGFGYTVAMLPHPLTFTIATIGFAFIPFGAWIAFGAASLLLLTKGSTLAAAFLFLYSSIIMLVGDNLVQPAVIGSSIRLPFLWTFVGIFGGVYSFGLVGLFVGPAIMAAMFLVWTEWWDSQTQRE